MKARQILQYRHKNIRGRLVIPASLPLAVSALQAELYPTISIADHRSFLVTSQINFVCLLLSWLFQKMRITNNIGRATTDALWWEEHEYAAKIQIHTGRDHKHCTEPDTQGRVQQKFRSEHEADIIIHQAAKKYFDSLGITKLPSVKSLREEYAGLLEQIVCENKGAYWTLWNFYI